MRSLIQSLLILSSAAALLTSTAQANTHTWPDARRQVVVYAPEPVLKLRYTHLGADRDVWAQLDIELGYDDRAIEQQSREISTQFTGFQLQRAVLRPDGQYAIQIPALRREFRVTPSPGMTGPYVLHTEYLNRRDADRVRAAWGEGAVTVAGRYRAHVPSSRVIEQVQADPGLCRRMGRDGDALFTVLMNYHALVAEYSRRSFTHPSTLVSLKHSMLTECLESTGRFESITELLAMPVSVRESGRPVGETYSDGMSEHVLPLHYTVHVEPLSRE